MITNENFKDLSSTHKNGSFRRWIIAAIKRGKMMRLDIGCGDRPTGDVNCDLYKGKSPHLRGRHIDPKTIPNFVRCDANFLPFRDKIFCQSFCSHVIEHEGVNDIKVLSEMIRVTWRKITVIVPHRFKRLHQFEKHDKYYNVTSLATLFKKMGLNPRIEITKYRYVPPIFFTLIRLPSEIKVEAMLK